MCREMKDSGVKWIGCIPKTWNITKIKMLSDIYTGTSISDDLKDKYTVKENATPYISTKDLDVSYKSIDYDNGLFIPNGEKGFRLAEKDSTLICIEGGSAGKKVAFTDREVNFVNKLCCIKSRNYNNKFIYYYINSSAFTEQFNLNLSGLIGGVSINLLKQIITVVPTVAEQQKISNYLDKKVSQIDDIILKQKSLIEKYKDYKQSLITETVTKGLNKNVPMKASGIEWIGEIPSYWQIKSIKYLCSCNDDSLTNSEDENKIINYVDISSVTFESGIVNYEELLFKNAPSRARRVTQAGDIIISTVRTYLKAIAIIPDDKKYIVSTGFAVIRAKNILNRYLDYFVKSEYFINQVSLYSKGISYPAIDSFDLMNIKILEPSIEEQKDIANFLDRKCSAIDSAISKKEQLIEKLESYKKSLIYECVTGKREVN